MGWLDIVGYSVLLLALDFWLQRFAYRAAGIFIPVLSSPVLSTSIEPLHFPSRAPRYFWYAVHTCTPGLPTTFLSPGAPRLGTWWSGFLPFSNSLFTAFAHTLPCVFGFYRLSCQILRSSAASLIFSLLPIILLHSQAYAQYAHLTLHFLIFPSHPPQVLLSYSLERPVSTNMRLHLSYWRHGCTLTMCSIESFCGPSLLVDSSSFACRANTLLTSLFLIFYMGRSIYICLINPSTAAGPSHRLVQAPVATSGWGRRVYAHLVALTYRALFSLFLHIPASSSFFGFSRTRHCFLF